MTKFLSLLFLLFAGRVNATTYYVCDAARGTDAIGLDSRSAATASNKATPWLTYSKGLGQFGSLLAGDSIAFCDGGTFGSVTAGNLTNANSTMANPVMVTDYQPTTTLAPQTVTYSSSTSTQLTTSTTLTSGAWNGLWLQITHGTGMGTYVQITTNTATQVNVAAWPILDPSGATMQPDSTSVIVLRQAKPVMNCSGSFCIYFAYGSANPIPRFAGYTVSNLDLRGGGTVIWSILMKNGISGLTVDNVSINGFSAAFQSTDASLGATVISGDGRNSDITLKNSTITGNTGIVVGLSGDNVIVENNFFDKNGSTADFYEHSIYLGGAIKIINPVAVSSMSGDGSTITVVTSVPHNLPNAARASVVNVTGGTGGTGTFTTAKATVTYVNSTTFTYPATGNGTYTGAAYFIQSNGVSQNQIIRNNIIKNAAPVSIGTCTEASVVSHGNHVGLTIENNQIIEDSINPTAPGNSHCYAIEIDSGQYSPPDYLEGYTNVIIRGNYIANYAIGIGLDIASNALIENNYIYSLADGTNTGTVSGIVYRSKNFSPTVDYGTAYPGCASGSTLCFDLMQPNNVTIRNNTIYLPNATGVINVSGTAGISLNANVGDLKTGTNFRVVNNIVIFGSSVVSPGACFDYSNMTAAMFDVIDYNICYQTGTAVWARNSGSATVLAGASLATFKTNNPTMDQHSLTTSPTINAPLTSTRPPYQLTIPASGSAYNAGHPTKSSPYAIGGKLRSGTGSPSIGAYEPNATVVLPGSATSIKAQ